MVRLGSDRSFRERLLDRAAAAGIGLDTGQLTHLEQYFELLLRWNRTINLTSLPIAELPDSTLDRLFIEPLQAAQFIADSPLVWFDLGSGGGSPAIPLKIVRPRLKLTMVESRSRKAAFLSEAVRLLVLTGTAVMSVRIEELGRHVGPATLDLITVRAVKLEDAIIREAATLLQPSGRLILFRSTHEPPTFDGFRTLEDRPLAGDGSTLRILGKVG